MPATPERRVVAVIPARGGSKGVPAKNLAAVGGVPLVARAVRECRASRLVTDVVVSTDDAGIAAAARGAGAEVVQRPPAIAGDTATSEAAVLHALDAFESRHGTAADVVLLVQCTSPFIAREDVDGVAAAVLEDGADSALTVAPFHGFVWRDAADDDGFAARAAVAGAPDPVTVVGQASAAVDGGAPGPVTVPAGRTGDGTRADGTSATAATASGTATGAAVDGAATGRTVTAAALLAGTADGPAAAVGTAVTGHRAAPGGATGSAAARTPAGAEDAEPAGSSGYGVNHDKSFRPRRQDRPQDLLETGAAYAMRVEGFRAEKHRFFGRTALVRTDAARVLEIDDPHDLARARALAPLLDAPRPGALPTRDDVDAVVLDFDGTQTDDRVLIDSDGRELVAVHRGDGLGVAALRRSGLALLILSTERNPVVAARARKLDIPVLHGIDRKDLALKQWCEEQGIAPERVLYAGNDVNDLPCFDVVGWPVAVANAHDVVRGAARAVTSTPGGQGAIREIASWLLGKELA
ncbi:acylneuraminate cytidylyltransferase [Streptomyces sp. LX-29]|uniref:acylneuraminate cytidylyltransferase n=1 Tax=Streptomyces sp. LX-29 TaxID=2900152 RepID=UPI00240D1EC4|nr:acylneuraminate cytidylyltransferase [Streptomyces sp. LX-29]WFB09025.1 acylneuraminate cytidylyltransferase [Streptomyces sp. LX-29]